MIGLKDEGSEAFGIAVHTARLVFDSQFDASGKMGCSGHTPSPQVAARLRLSDDSRRLLSLYAERYQVFPNGFAHYLGRDAIAAQGEYLSRVLSGTEKITEWERVHEKDAGKRVRLPAEDFLHMYFEPSSNIASGVLESLIQSHDGIIRVFPAIPAEERAAFSLLAYGNFLVTAEKKPWAVAYVRIMSIAGGKCRVKLPWDASETAANKGGSRFPDLSFSGGIAEFETAAGETVLLYPKSAPPEQYYRETPSSFVNDGVKRKGRAVLGKERDF